LRSAKYSHSESEIPLTGQWKWERNFIKVWVNGRLSTSRNMPSSLRFYNQVLYIYIYIYTTYCNNKQVCIMLHRLFNVFSNFLNRNKTNCFYNVRCIFCVTYEMNCCVNLRWMIDVKSLITWGIVGGWEGCDLGLFSGISKRYVCNSARCWRVLMASFVFSVWWLTDFHDKMKLKSLVIATTLKIITFRVTLVFQSTNDFHAYQCLLRTLVTICLN
jgi:hypothetical protein